MIGEIDRFYDKGIKPMGRNVYENKGYVARDYHNNEKFLTKSLLKSKVN